LVKVKCGGRILEGTTSGVDERSDDRKKHGYIAHLEENFEGEYLTKWLGGVYELMRHQKGTPITKLKKQRGKVTFIRFSGKKVEFATTCKVGGVFDAPNFLRKFTKKGQG